MGKIESGIWDWIGVHKDGQFVLGRPKRSGGSGAAVSATVYEEDDVAQGQHGVRVRVPLGPGRGSARWFHTEQEAKEEFTRRVRELKDEEEGPGLFKVVRVARGEIVEE